jgi:succinoglycan biosynthesis transport protein ExoP
VPSYDNADMPRRLQSNTIHAYAAEGPPLVDAPPPRRAPAMRRRILVFFSVFLLSAIAGLAYNYSRPAVYLADARVQLTPSALGASIAASGPRDASQDFLIELQTLNSRPVLEQVAERVADALPPDAGGDRVQQLQAMLRTLPVEGTNVVRIEVRGPDRQNVARIANTLIEVYRAQQSTSGDDALQQQLVQARETLGEMDARVEKRRLEVEEFRARSAIVSAERNENQVLARLKGMGESAAKTNDRVADAQGRVRALEDALAQGGRNPLAKDNPTVAAMETRLSQMREDYKSLERQFTPQYLEMDPNARSVRNRIASLEQQLQGERSKGMQSALAAARDELASAKATADRLQQQFSEDRDKVQTFTRRFAEFETMKDDLKGLEQVRQSARQRLLALEASAKERKPRLLVVEPAAVPDRPWQPQYERDAALVVGGALVLGFLAVWFVEFFNRTEPVAAAPSTVIIPQTWAQPYPPGPALAGAPDMSALGHQPVAPTPVAPSLLGQGLPRELEAYELGPLLAATAPEHLPVLVCLLCGLSADEVAALQRSDLDPVQHQLQVGGEAARTVPLLPALSQRLAAAAGAAGGSALLPGPGGQALTPADIASAVTSAAFDAGLDQPPSVTPEALRHTYVAFLVRQGLRFGDLGRVVGRLTSEQLNALAPLAPPGERRPLAEVERLLPAVAALESSVA